MFTPAGDPAGGFGSGGGEFGIELSTGGGSNPSSEPVRPKNSAKSNSRSGLHRRGESRDRIVAASMDMEQTAPVHNLSYAQWTYEQHMEKAFA